MNENKVKKLVENLCKRKIIDKDVTKISPSKRNMPGKVKANPKLQKKTHPTHKSADCKKGKLCIHCGVLNSHHRILCPKKFRSALTSVHLSEEYDNSSCGLSSGVEQSLTSLSEQRETTSENMLTSSSETVLMQIAKVEVNNPNDSLKQTTRLLFDSGSQRTYVSQKLASKLKLKSEGDEEITIVTFGSEKARTVKTASTSLCIRLNNGKVLKISANIVPVISGTVQRRRLDTFCKGPSQLGWIITGRTKENDYSREDIESSFLIMSYTGSNVPKTDTCITSLPNVTYLWNLESIGISDDDNSTEDSRALEMFKETLEYSNGWYYVTWPWKNDKVDLPVNRVLALSRLKSYQLDKGIVEKGAEHSTEVLKHYIPHHAVITPNKTTTKLRILYDASAKPNNEVNSLNECLYRGPVLLKNLCGIFLRFRLNQVAIVANIEKAFLQVGLQKSDRDVTRFLWLKNYKDGYASDANLQEYRFCRVPFGIISSTFLLATTVESHLDIYQSPIARKIKDNIYVDNLISGCTSVAESLEFYSEAKYIF
ncbi:unnamed protein product [Mytilus coruscus]|uniref:DUF1758 domain-containing protein n=1 Tax=Mytilus coruscus TaxID=42192 RepID=A0A6J8EIP0_MYTCO|nr:unnamed protein product [Mytilus coruscus]